MIISPNRAESRFKYVKNVEKWIYVKIKNVKKKKLTEKPMGPKKSYNETR